MSQNIVTTRWNGSLAFSLMYVHTIISKLPYHDMSMASVKTWSWADFLKIVPLVSLLITPNNPLLNSTHESPHLALTHTKIQRDSRPSWWSWYLKLTLFNFRKLPKCSRIFFYFQGASLMCNTQYFPFKLLNPFNFSWPATAMYSKRTAIVISIFHFPILRIQTRSQSQPSSTETSSIYEWLTDSRQNPSSSAGLPSALVRHGFRRSNRLSSSSSSSFDIYM